jgi:hypothetical protein
MYLAADGAKLGLKNQTSYLNQIWAYAENVKLASTGLTSVIETSDRQELKSWGLESAGVYEYGDIAANVQGYIFWSNLTTGPAPYFVCRNQRWAQAREFSWGPYIDDGWDEAINCSDFSKSVYDLIIANIAKTPSDPKLGQTTNRCPVSPAKCEALKARYRGSTAGALNSSCKNGAR